MLIFVQIKTELGSTEQVLKALKNFPNMKQVHPPSEVYDIIGPVEVGSPKQLRETVAKNIRSLDKINANFDRDE